MDNKLLIDMGQRIFLLRQKHDLTQAQLAEYLDVSTKHISSVERGRSRLSLELSIRLCDYFSCSLDYLILGKSNQAPLKYIPTEIIHMLETGSDMDKDRIHRFLLMYLEIH